MSCIIIRLLLYRFFLNERNNWSKESLVAYANFLFRCLRLELRKHLIRMLTTFPPPQFTHFAI